MSGVEIRSYRRVFDLERRIYRIDRVRLNPGGIPVRGLLYFIASLLCALFVRRLPLVGALQQILPWYLADVAFPALVATLLSALRIDGRPFHVAARTIARYACGPRRLERFTPTVRFGARWHPPELIVLPDGSDARMRRLRYTGPGVVLIAPAHLRAHYVRGRIARLLGRPELILSELSERRPPARAQLLELASGVRMVVR